MKEYQVSDLFFNDWKHLQPKQMFKVFTLYQELLTISKTDKNYGLVLIAILRLLRRRPLLVDKINEAQAVDCFNELKFLNEPWHFFPELRHLVTPDECIGRHTFDHFIYADGEFTSYLVKRDESYLRKLVVTLYQESKDEHFDRDEVKFRATYLQATPWQLMLVFYTFGHVRTFITNRCKHLLPKPPKSDEPQTPKVSFPMWDDIKHSAARTLVFGSFADTGRANVYDVLDHLEKLAKEQAERKQHATT